MITSYGETSGFSVVSAEELLLVNGGKGNASNSGKNSIATASTEGTKKGTYISIEGINLSVPIIGNITIPTKVVITKDDKSLSFEMTSSKTPEQVYADKEMGKLVGKLTFTKKFF